MNRITSDIIHLGFDIGSISVNTVLINNSGEVIFEDYSYCHGQPYNVVLKILSRLEKKFGLTNFSTV